MSKTTVSASVTDSRMWRRLLSRAHPDTGGDQELFVWVQYLREHIESQRDDPFADLLAYFSSERPTPKAPRKRAPQKQRKKKQEKPWSERRSKERVPLETDLSFDELTARALEVAHDFNEPYDYIFSLLAGCEAPSPDDDSETVEKAEMGAGYAVLADIGRALGLDKRGRHAIYRYGGVVPLTQRHALYLLREAKRLVEESPDRVAWIRRTAPCRKG